MAVSIEPLKCNGCCLCEMACSYHRDEAFSLLSSSIMVYRAEEKKNYFGLILKLEDTLLLGRPEGVEEIGISDLQAQAGGGGSSAKPIMIRESCDGCRGRDVPLCAAYCPTGALTGKEAES